jgi:hypothetical protein
MPIHFLMGALIKNTLQYEHPLIASKTNQYVCPDCRKDVIFKKGEIRAYHFAHYKDENPCHYYNHPSESQIHKDAKLLLKRCLENSSISLCFTRICKHCQWIEEIPIQKNECKAEIEYTFLFNESSKSADVALLDTNGLKYIFEICYKHKTKPEDRPEPWFEIDAEEFIKTINTSTDNNYINITCIRNYQCNPCLTEEKKRNEFYKKMFEERERRRLELEDLEKRKEQEKIAAEILRKQKEQERLDAERILKEKEEALQRKIQLIHQTFFEQKEALAKQCLQEAREQVKRCSKCKKSQRCSKCVSKIDKLYRDDLSKVLAEKGIKYLTEEEIRTAEK